MRWLLAFMLLASVANAQKALMENVNATGNAFKVNTSTGRVTISTSSYTGAVSNVGLFVSSNIVVGTLANKDACVIYATGSITCLGIVLGSGGGGASTMTVAFQTDNFISQANGSNKVFTLSATPQSSSAVWVVLDGILLSGTSDYSIAGPVVTVVTAPAIGSSGFFIQYAVNTSTLPGIGILIATQSWSGGNSFSSAAFTSYQAIVSSHPCRVVQSTTVANIASATATNVTIGVSLPGSTVTFPSPVVVPGHYACFSAAFGMMKNNNNGSGIFGATALLDAVIIGPQTGAVKLIWGTKGNFNTTVFQAKGGDRWCHPTPLSLGSHSASLAIMSTNASDTATFHPGTDASNWFTMEEYTCLQ